MMLVVVIGDERRQLIPLTSRWLVRVYQERKDRLRLALVL